MSIAKFADWLGEAIAEKAALEEVEKKKVCYGMECFLVVFISAVLTLVVGWLIGVFREALIILMASMIMKYIIGGPHFRKFYKCLLSGIVMINVTAFFYKEEVLNLGLWSLISLIFCGILIIVYAAPLLNSCKKFNRQKKQQKKLHGCLLWLTIILSNMLVENSWLNCVLLGSFLAILNISPTSVWLIKALDKLILPNFWWHISESEKID